MNTDQQVIDPLPPEVMEAINSYGRYYAEHHKLGMSVRDDMKYVASVAIRCAQSPAAAPEGWKRDCITCMQEASEVLSEERPPRGPLADELWGFSLMLRDSLAPSPVPQAAATKEKL